jgi:tRNA nucleotidyltransferase (CCA-adding enzyme)
VLNPNAYPEVRAPGQKTRVASVDKIMEALVDGWFIPALKKLKPDNMQKTYSQHPYLSAKLDDFDVDIVGCFEVSAKELSTSGPISAMDRTIHHSEYVNLHLNDESRDDVRILKSFARASHAYGDTCAVGRMGFTGYALEILIIQNGSLQQALNAIVNLETTPLDPEGRALSLLKEKTTFRDDYVFIIDPTDSNRNVASSFGERAVKLLKLLAKKLLQEVAEENVNRIREMIIEKPIQIDEIPSSIMENSIVFEFEAEKIYHYTIVRDKLYSLGKLVAGQLQKEQTGESRFGPVIFEVYFEGDFYSLAFLVGKMQAPRTYLSKGPPLNLVDAVEEFKRAHFDTTKKEGYIWTTRTRVHTSAIELAESLIARHGIKGLSRKKPEDTSRKLLRIIHDYVLPVEVEFPIEKDRELV